LINLKSISLNDFTESPKGMYLKTDAVKRFLDQFEAEMERKKGNTTLSLEEDIYVQVYIFKKWAIEDRSLSFYKWNI